ncbi:hypothetical protein OsI_34869 [Oryza sativa Indica Group]|uniref:Uncharacterized protein n=1 Tax=Oryza sativa subsp. indica TaxID=39946 RepID=B8BIQ8_ORYSI|nr:hypothetical protein OsI_34869 [Oryza sativa Indica Group]
MGSGVEKEGRAERSGRDMGKGKELPSQILPPEPPLASDLPARSPPPPYPSARILVDEELRREMQKRGRAAWSGEGCAGRSGTEVGRESGRRRVDGIDPGEGGGEKARERERERDERNLGGGTAGSLMAAYLYRQQKWIHHLVSAHATTHLQSTRYVGECMCVIYACQANRTIGVIAILPPAACMHDYKSSLYVYRIILPASMDGYPSCYSQSKICQQVFTIADLQSLH